MALTNIIKEPRREITESAFGMAIVAAVTAASYYPGSGLASWFEHVATTAVPHEVTVPLGMLIVFLAGWAVLAVTHNIGESFCNNMANRGIELRGQRNRR